MRHPQDHHLFYAMLAYERAWHRLSPEEWAKGLHAWLLGPPADVLGLVEAIVDVEHGVNLRPSAVERRFARMPGFLRAQVMESNFTVTAMDFTALYDAAVVRDSLRPA